ncbi:phosphopantetheine-binding protein [Luteolibacter algae]|uniref:Phosphopantetheine-binding protein n=1 Tax=Luteolibacter algae TaxID=454151 RepID=A0ABW5D8T7_9BACT
MTTNLIFQLRALINEQLFPLDDSISAEADLHSEGLDSLALMQLILLLENEYGVSIKPEDLDRENFSSLSKISEMISKKRELGT